ncbi:MAG: putative membrane protein [Clostridia bacterium 62_21]|nr:MAG: putative membrane protein [Clostridia bacterium 62_21]
MHFRAGLKRMLWALSFLVAVILYFPAAAGAYTVTRETLLTEPVTRGVTLTSYLQETDEGPLKIYVLRVDLTDRYVRLDVLLGGDNESFAETRTVREMAERAGAVAALNGDFFHLKEGRHPLGMVVRRGELLASPMQRTDYYSLALLRDGRPVIDLFGFTGEVAAPNGAVFPLSGINKPGYTALADGQSVPSDVDRLHLYTPAWGPLSRGASPDLPGVVEMVVADGRVQEIREDRPGVPIPENGYVLRAHGRAAAFVLQNFAAGDPVTLHYRVEPDGEEVLTALGGQALLVENGRRVAKFSQNIPGRAARSAAGITAAGNTMYLVAVEQSAGSRGMTQEELADFMVERLGVWRALNLDGGGSTSLVARPLGEFTPVPVNLPARGAERRVPNALGVFSTAPAGDLAGIVVRGPTEILAGVKTRYVARGYDGYYNPYRLDDGKVTWVVEQGDGDVENGVLTATKGGTLVLAARSGGVTGRLTIRALGYEDLASLEVAPAQITLAPGAKVNLEVHVRGKDGRRHPLDPQYVTWHIDPRIGTVQNGVFFAGAEAVAGRLVARFNRLEAEIPVEVVPPGEQFVWAGPEGAEIRRGGLTVRIPAAVFDTPTPVRVAPLPEPGDLPAGWEFLGGVRLLPGAAAAPGVTYPVRWLSGEIPVTAATFFVRQAGGAWVRQPAWSEAGSVTGRLACLGDIALAVPTEAPTEPQDLACHWSRDAVLALMQQDLIRGFPDGTFRPGEPVTRAQFAVLLAGVFGWTAPPDAGLPFRDRIPEWAAAGIAAATARGVITGYPDGYFRPAKPITRAEMAVLVDRALSLGPGEAPAFADAQAVPQWAAAAVGRVAAAGLMQGADGRFRPLAATTRGETAVLACRVLQYWTRW